MNTLASLALAVLALTVPAGAQEDSAQKQAPTKASAEVAAVVQNKDYAGSTIGLIGDTYDEPAAAKLDQRLKPKTMAELETEAKAWREVLKLKVQQISERLTDADANNDDVTGLTEHRTKIIDRVNVTLAAWKAKGGEPKEFQAYVSAVSGIQLDATDVSGMWNTIVGWITSTEGGVRIGINLLIFIAILLAFRVLSNVAGKITSRAVGAFKGTSDLLRNFFVNVVRKLTFFIGLVVAMPFIGIDIGPFLAAIGAAGFIIGFALQGTLSNFASGIMILMYRPYEIGNWVTVAGVSGSVSAMTLVSTTITTGDNQRIVVPNSAIWGGVITNVTGNTTRRIDLVFGVGYDDDHGRVQSVLEEVMRGHEKVLKDPEPVIKLHELGDSSVNFVARPWVKTSDYWSVRWDLMRTVKERFDAEGVSIPFPQRDVHLHQVQAETARSA